MTDVDVLDKLSALWPEIVMLIGATLCLFAGLARSADVRRVAPGIAAGTLVLAGLVVTLLGRDDTAGLGFGGVAAYVRLSVVLVGLVLLMVAVGVPDSVRQHRDADAAGGFDASSVIGGEFYAFFLFSLTGVMLVAGAGDLAWLFLALELVSLPTYVLIAISRNRSDAHESAIKYFFLGAVSVAFFLYGFALIYGATGYTDLALIKAVAVEQIAATGSVSPLFLTGIVLAVIGISFKIAAAPMHFYAADVYQGAHTAVTAFLAFVPKAAGFIAILLLLSLVGWPLDKTPVVDGGDALVWILWLIAAATMTVGNVLGLLQTNVKRALAYSSVAQSGYMLVGVLAGPAAVHAVGGPLSDGVAGVLFYLLAYGFSTIAAFAALGCLATRGGEEVQTYEDLQGLYRRHPILAGILAIAALSLLGIPPMVGFIGKAYLFLPAYSAGFIGLVVIALINSAISAGYYLPIAAACFFGTPVREVDEAPVPLRRVAAAVAALTAIILGIAGGVLVDAAAKATPGTPGPAAVEAVATAPLEAPAAPREAAAVSLAPVAP